MADDVKSFRPSIFCGPLIHEDRSFSETFNFKVDCDRSVSAIGDRNNFDLFGMNGCYSWVNSPKGLKVGGQFEHLFSTPDSLYFSLETNILFRGI